MSGTHVLPGKHEEAMKKMDHLFKGSDASEDIERSVRSALVQAGRFTCRWCMMRGFRNRALAARSWDLRLLGSASDPSSNKGESDFVQRTKCD